MQTPQTLYLLRHARPAPDPALPAEGLATVVAPFDHWQAMPTPALYAVSGQSWRQLETSP